MFTSPAFGKHKRPRRLQSKGAREEGMVAPGAHGMPGNSRGRSFIFSDFLRDAVHWRVTESPGFLCCDRVPGGGHPESASAGSGSAPPAVAPGTANGARHCTRHGVPALPGQWSHGLPPARGGRITCDSQARSQDSDVAGSQSLDSRNLDSSKPSVTRLEHT